MRTFFEAQRYYRHMSHVYYGLFMVVALMQFLVTFFIVGLTVYVIAGNLNGYVAILICVGFLIYLGIGFFIAKKRVAQGGLSVAQSVKAVRLFVHKDASTQAVYTPKHIRVSNLRDLPAPYQRYYEFAAQMAIASGIVLPKLYVLPFESAVNGFVAGFGDEDRVMVLTQGAVEHLSNAELYGLIGHEFGHILHGDARLNLRLFVVLTTLTWCHELVDRIEMLAFGHFDRNYHGDHDFYGSWQVSNPVSKNEWMLLLTSHRRQTEAYYETHTASKGSFSKVGTVSQSAMHDAISARGLFGVVTFAIPLLFLKLISVVSLAGAEWLKQQFNRQREYLADATSVQLTRSPDVVNALQSLQVKYSTALYNKDFSTCMSHFFFASPEPDGVKIGMHTHPYIYERIDAIKFDHHLSFAQSVTAHLNHDSLQKAHDYAMAYHDIKETLKTSAPEPKEDTALAFEAPAERIIDGRLVIDDWLPEDSKRSQTLYPQQVTPHAITGIITPSQIKALALPWSITHNLTSITGIINLLECTLACHHYRTIDPDTKVDIRVLYTPRVIHLDARSIANTDPHSDTH